MGFYSQKVEALSNALAAQGIDPSDMDRESIQALPGILFDDEMLILASTGSMFPDLGPGILVATDHRLIFVGDPQDGIGFRPPHSISEGTVAIALARQSKITEVQSRTVSPDDAGELRVTYNVPPEAETRTMHVSDLSSGKPKQFADFVREKCGLSSTE